MKVLLVTFSDNADHQDTVFGLFEQLHTKMDVRLLTIREPKIPLERNEDTWLIDCPERPGICKKTFKLDLLVGVIRRIRKEKFDSIYFESLHVWNLPIMMAAGRRTKIYQVIHEVIPHEGDRQVRMVELMNKAVCKLADVIVLRNQKYRETLMEKYRLPAVRVACMELWRRYPAFTEPTHSGTMLFFGRVNPYKGADNLLAIAQRCPQITFRMIGRVDPQMVAVARQLKELPNVSLHDSYVSDDDMKQAFIEADWVILPYNSASQSGVIIDAYKYSRPVIAFDVGAISEQMDHENSGYLIPAGDIDAFVTQVEAVTRMPVEAYDAFCRRAYAFGCEKYAVKGAVGRFLKMIGQEDDAL